MFGKFFFLHLLLQLYIVRSGLLCQELQNNRHGITGCDSESFSESSSVFCVFISCYFTVYVRFVTVQLLAACMFSSSTEQFSIVVLFSANFISTNLE